MFNSKTSQVAINKEALKKSLKELESLRFQDRSSQLKNFIFDLKDPKQLMQTTVSLVDSAIKPDLQENVGLLMTLIINKNSSLVTHAIDILKSRTFSKLSPLLLCCVARCPAVTVEMHNDLLKCISPNLQKKFITELVRSRNVAVLDGIVNNFESFGLTKAYAYRLYHTTSQKFIEKTIQKNWDNGLIVWEKVALHYPLVFITNFEIMASDWDLIKLQDQWYKFFNRLNLSILDNAMLKLIFDCFLKHPPLQIKVNGELDVVKKFQEDYSEVFQISDCWKSNIANVCRRMHLKTAIDCFETVLKDTKYFVEFPETIFNIICSSEKLNSNVVFRVVQLVLDNLPNICSQIAFGPNHHKKKMRYNNKLENYDIVNRRALFVKLILNSGTNFSNCFSWKLISDQIIPKLENIILQEVTLIKGLFESVRPHEFDDETLKRLLDPFVLSSQFVIDKLSQLITRKFDTLISLQEEKDYMKFVDSSLNCMERLFNVCSVVIGEIQTFTSLVPSHQACQIYSYMRIIVHEMKNFLAWLSSTSVLSRDHLNNKLSQLGTELLKQNIARGGLIGEISGRCLKLFDKCNQKIFDWIKLWTEEYFHSLQNSMISGLIPTGKDSDFLNMFTKEIMEFWMTNVDIETGKIWIDKFVKFAETLSLGEYKARARFNGETMVMIFLGRIARMNKKPADHSRIFRAFESYFAFISNSVTLDASTWNHQIVCNYLKKLSKDVFRSDTYINTPSDIMSSELHENILLMVCNSLKEQNLSSALTKNLNNAFHEISQNPQLKPILTDIAVNVLKRCEGVPEFDDAVGYFVNKHFSKSDFPVHQTPFLSLIVPYLPFEDFRVFRYLERNLSVVNDLESRKLWFSNKVNELFGYLLADPRIELYDPVPKFMETFYKPFERLPWIRLSNSHPFVSTTIITAYLPSTGNFTSTLQLQKSNQSRESNALVRDLLSRVWNSMKVVEPELFYPFFLNEFRKFFEPVLQNYLFWSIAIKAQKYTMLEEMDLKENFLICQDWIKFLFEIVIDITVAMQGERAKEELRFLDQIEFRKNFKIQLDLRAVDQISIEIEVVEEFESLICSIFDFKLPELTIPKIPAEMSFASVRFAQLLVKISKMFPSGPHFGERLLESIEFHSSQLCTETLFDELLTRKSNELMKSLQTDSLISKLDYSQWFQKVNYKEDQWGIPKNCNMLSDPYYGKLERLFKCFITVEKHKYSKHNESNASAGQVSNYLVAVMVHSILKEQKRKKSILINSLLNAIKDLLQISKSVVRIYSVEDILMSYDPSLYFSILKEEYPLGNQSSIFERWFKEVVSSKMKRNVPKCPNRNIRILDQDQEFLIKIVTETIRDKEESIKTKVNAIRWLGRLSSYTVENINALYFELAPKKEEGVEIEIVDASLREKILECVLSKPDNYESVIATVFLKEVVLDRSVNVTLLKAFPGFVNTIGNIFVDEFISQLRKNDESVQNFGMSAFKAIIRILSISLNSLQVLHEFWNKRDKLSVAVAGLILVELRNFLKHPQVDTRSLMEILATAISPQSQKSDKFPIFATILTLARPSKNLKPKNLEVTDRALVFIRSSLPEALEWANNEIKFESTKIAKEYFETIIKPLMSNEIMNSHPICGALVQSELINWVGFSDNVTNLLDQFYKERLLTSEIPISDDPKFAYKKTVFEWNVNDLMDVVTINDDQTKGTKVRRGSTRNMFLHSHIFRPIIHSLYDIFNDPNTSQEKKYAAAYKISIISHIGIFKSDVFDFIQSRDELVARQKYHTAMNTALARMMKSFE